LVGEVDGCVHDAGAMCADRVGDVSDVDCVQVLVVARTLHKDLQHQAMTTHFSLYNVLGQPHVKWTDQLRRNNNAFITTPWRQAIGRSRLTAVLLSKQTTC